MINVKKNEQVREPGTSMTRILIRLDLVSHSLSSVRGGCPKFFIKVINSFLLEVIKF